MILYTLVAYPPRFQSKENNPDPFVVSSHVLALSKAVTCLSHAFCLSQSTFTLFWVEMLTL